MIPVQAAGVWSGLGALPAAPRPSVSSLAATISRGGPVCGPGTVHAWSTLDASGGAGGPGGPPISLPITHRRGEVDIANLPGPPGPDGHHDREAPRPRVPRQRPHRARSGQALLAPRHRGHVLAMRTRARAGLALRHWAPRPGCQTHTIEPRARARAVQPQRGRTTRCRHHERSTTTPGVDHAHLACRSRAVVTGVFFAGPSNPRLRLQQQNPPLNWRSR